VQPASASHDPTAVVARRIGAYVVDVLIGFGIVVAVFFALAEHPSSPTDLTQSQAESLDANFDSSVDVEMKWNLGDAFGGFHSESDVWFVEGSEFWFLNLLYLGYGLLVLVSLQGATGRTPGKALFGIATVGADGEPPGVGKAMVRWVVLFVDSFLLLPGLVTMLASRGHRRIGDMAAGTYVVRADAVGQPVDVDTAPLAAATAPSAYTPPPMPRPGEPVWDPARNAYIRWDPDVQRWFQWHDATQQWQPIG
jgi:uncharacterized RDD family membrane protein YckC